MKLLIANKLGKAGLDILENQRRIRFDYREKMTTEDLPHALNGYDGLIVRSQPEVTREALHAGKTLKVVGRAGVGLDSIDVNAAKEFNIEVINCPNANTISAAEHTFALMMAVNRHLIQAHQSLKDGQWNRKAYVGTELFGKTLGLLGCGRIASHVTKIAKGFQMNVIGYDPYISNEEALERGIQKRDTLEEILAESDILSLHLRKTAETIDLIARKELTLMKPTATLINCARGGIVNEPALHNALKTGIIAGAGIDVWNNEPDTTNPLQQLTNVVATPHLGASTKEAQERVSRDVVLRVIEKLS
jgi:D-3-phosphoglycerate dehydrogenase / 2-oxoglutarate reductase